MAQPRPGADPATPTPQKLAAEFAAMVLLTVFFFAAIIAGFMGGPRQGVAAIAGASLVCSLALGLGPDDES